MKTKKHSVYFNITFTGLYGWGGGWASEELREKWNKFWETECDEIVNPIFWKAFAGDHLGRVNFLVSTCGSVYLHPMSCRGMVWDGGVSCDGMYCASEIRELDKILKACADYCGCAYELKVSGETETEYELAEYAG